MPTSYPCSTKICPTPITGAPFPERTSPGMSLGTSRSSRATPGSTSHTDNRADPRRFCHARSDWSVCWAQVAPAHLQRIRAQHRGRAMGRRQGPSIACGNVLGCHSGGADMPALSRRARRFMMPKRTVGKRRLAKDWSNEGRPHTGPGSAMWPDFGQLAQLCPASTVIGPMSSKIAPNLSRVRPTLARMRPILPAPGRIRSTLARTRPKVDLASTNIGPYSAEFGPESADFDQHRPNSTKLGPTSTRPCPISANFGPPGEAERYFSGNAY